MLYFELLLGPSIGGGVTILTFRIFDIYTIRRVNIVISGAGVLDKIF